MPQLSIETFVTQYVWLLVILLTFYYFNVTEFIPKISETIKLRGVIENEQEGAKEEEKSHEGKLLMSEVLKVKLGEEKKSGYEEVFKNNNLDWINKIK